MGPETEDEQERVQRASDDADKANIPAALQSCHENRAHHLVRLSPVLFLITLPAFGGQPYLSEKALISLRFGRSLAGLYFPVEGKPETLEKKTFLGSNWWDLNP